MSGEKEKVGVIGAGSWGTAVANTFAEAGADVAIWGRDAAVLKGISDERENSKYLRGLPLSERLNVVEDLGELLDEARIVVCSIPTQQIRNVFGPHQAKLAGKVLVNTSKGIEQGTHACVHEIFSDIAPSATYAVLSGPSFAKEVVQKRPTAVTVGCRDGETAKQIQQSMATSYFRVYTATDVVGVDLGGALKNVIAIACGISAGLDLGHNAQAAIINRGIGEIVRLGRKKGADPYTFLGLSGMGDLVLTCTGPLSRNRRFGIAVGEGKPLETIQSELGGVAEGYYTARSAYELSQKLGVEMPITEQIFRILYEGETAKGALHQLMNRDLKDEWSA